MKKLVIFGTADIAELARFYFSHDGNFEVVAYTVDDDFVKEDQFDGLPMVPFSEISNRFPASDYNMFVAVGYSKVNETRKAKYLACRQLGYSLASYVSSRAYVAPNTRFGDNCFIFEDNTIQPFVTIGSNVTLWSGNHIGHHTKIEDHCFITSHVVVAGRCVVKEACFLGINSTIRDHITIGERSIIGAGALILGDVLPEGVYIGTATERSRLPSSKLRRI